VREGGERERETKTKADDVDTQNFLTDRSIALMNENAIANVVIDLDFLEEQFRGAGRANLVSLFIELRLVSVARSSAALSPRAGVSLLFLSLQYPYYVGDINCDVRFRNGVPCSIITPNDVRNCQAKKARCTT
jgi:hypothetical protein